MNLLRFQQRLLFEDYPKQKRPKAIIESFDGIYRIIDMFDESEKNFQEDIQLMLLLEAAENFKIMNKLR